MRVTILLGLITIFFGLSLWVLFSGVWFVMAFIVFLVFLVISVGYADTAILFYLGAREVRSNDEAPFFQAAAGEAYKLAVPMPSLYFYNGTLERGYVLHARNSYSLVLSKNLLDACGPDELSAICFELLLQVKKGMASKRTKTMFLLGSISWVCHSVMALFTGLIPNKEIQQSSDWFLNFLLHPWLSFLFKVVIGEGYFKRLQSLMSDYPGETERLSRLGLKLRKPDAIYSLPSRKLIEFSSITRNRHFQNILALEFLPHEWDFFFGDEEKIRA